MTREYRFSSSDLRALFTYRLYAFFVSLAFGLSLSYSCTAADNSAAPFPNRPVRIIVSFPAGGSADIFARIFADNLTEEWKQRVVVDNRPGGNGAIGGEIVARSPKDGYTMGIISGTFAIVPALGQKMPFDVYNDFSVINRNVEVPAIVVVGSSPSLANAKTFADFANVARSKPKQVSYAAGTGAFSHLASELLASAMNVEFFHVPYKGSAEGTADIIAGRVDFMVGTVPEVIGLVRSKTLRPIVVTSAKRLPFLPDVPSIGESLKDFELANWFAFVGPSGIPRPILEKLNADFGKVATSEKLRPTWDEQSVTGTTHSLKESEDHYRSELVRWDKVVKSLGLDKPSN